MQQPTTLFVGLDVHKDSIAVAHAQAFSTDPAHFVGTIGTRECDLVKLTQRLQGKASRFGVRLRGRTLRLRVAPLPDG